MALPLREFYPITRAAELLGCTVDDCVSWAMSGYIRLHLSIRRAYGWVSPFNTSYFCDDKKALGLFEEFNKLSIQYLGESIPFNFDGGMSTNKRNEFVMMIRELCQKISEIYPNGIELIDDLDVSYFYHCLQYESIKYTYHRFSAVLGLYPIASNIGEKYLKYLEELGVNRRNKKSAAYFVRVLGYWALGPEFFILHTLKKKILAGMMPKLFMAGSNFNVTLCVDKDFSFEIDELFISKQDFLSIRSIIDGKHSNGSMIRKYNISSGFGSDIFKIEAEYGGECESSSAALPQNNKPERISARMRDVLALLIDEYLGDVKNQPTKIASALEAIAEKKGKNFSISKDTITNWLKR